MKDIFRLNYNIKISVFLEKSKFLKRSQISLSESEFRTRKKSVQNSKIQIHIQNPIFFGFEPLIRIYIYFLIRVRNY